MASRLLIPLLLLAGAAIVAVDCNSEVDALNAWKVELSDPNNVLQSWDPTLVNPCSWFHITCNINNTVIRVDLGNANLSGPLVPQLGQLPNLQYLIVNGNNLSGSIPTAIGNLTNLVSLNLGYNLLTGSIPSSIGNLKYLRFMELNNNNVTGSIPAVIGNLNLLLSLDLSYNQLSGPVPASFGNLKSLESMRLNSNYLSGILPIDIIGLVTTGNLRILNVSENMLVGTVRGSNPKGFVISTVIQDPKPKAPKD